jgi:tight adherence protein C
VNPVLPAAALLACFVLGWRGLAMARDQGPAARILREEGLVAVPDERRSILGRLLDGLANSLAPRMLRLLGQDRIAAIRSQLDAAGRPHGWTLEIYAGKKATYTLLFGLAGLALLSSDRPLLGLLLGAAGFFWMDLALRVEAGQRQRTIDRELPDFLDILSVSVSAGLDFRSGMERTALAMPGPLAEEILMTLRKMEVGATRRAAFDELRRRNPSESLGQFVTALLQAEELGTPLTDTLRDIATEMRRASAQAARRRAARAAPRVSLVVTAVMMPGALVIIAVALFLSAGLDLGALSG